MLRFLFSLFFLVVALFSLLGGAFYWRGPLIIKTVLEAMDHSFCSCQIKTEKVRWDIRRPFQIEFLKSSITLPDSRLKVEKLRADFAFKILQPDNLWQLQIDMQIDDVSAGFVPSGQSRVEDSNSPKSKREPDLRELMDAIERLSFLNLKMRLKNGQIFFEQPELALQMVNLSQLNLQLDGDKQGISWDLAGSLETKISFLPKKLTFDSKGELVKLQEKIKFADTSFRILDLPVTLSGEVNVLNHSYDFNFKLQELELAQLTHLISPHPLRGWNGRLGLQAKIFRGDRFAPWILAGKVQAKNVQGSIDWKKDENHVSGPIRINAVVEGQYQQEQLPSIDRAEWELDLTASQVRAGSWFFKKPSTLLTTEGRLSFKENLKIESAQVNLASAKVLFDGVVAPSRMADIGLEVPGFSLAGMEMHFPFLEKFPITGDLGLRGSYKGSLLNPETAEVKLERMLLNKVRGVIDWNSDGLILSGPFSANMDGALNVEGKKVKSGQVKMNIDLVGMRIEKQNEFLKPARAPFDLMLSAQEENGSLRVNAGSLRGLFGQIAIRGLLPVPPVYSMNLNLLADQLNITNLKNMLPSYSSLIPDGQLSGQIAAKGEVSPLDFPNSRLNTFGHLKVRIPRYEIVSKPATTPGVERTQPLVPEPILPSLRVLQGLDLKLDLSVDELVWHQQSFKSVGFSLQMKEGLARGSSVIGKIFGGRVEFSGFELPLFSVDPTGKFAFKAEGLQTQSALNVFFPQWSGAVSGVFSGQVSGTSRLPSSPQFQVDLQSSGAFQVKDGSLKSLPLKEYLITKFGTVPQAKSFINKLSFPNAQLNLTGQFSLEKTQMHLKPIVITSREGHQIYLDGQLGFDRRIRFQGSLALSGLGGSGVFYEANRDERGNLIVPLAIDGELNRPEILILEDTLAQMTAKAMDYEKTRVINSAKNELNRKVQESTKQIKDQVEKKIGEQLKGLFKK